MQRYHLLTSAALASLAVLAACGRNETGGIANQQNEAVNTAQDIAGAATGVGTAAVGAVSTEAFLRDAAISDMYEIQAGQMALKRSTSAEVKKVAQMIIDDHMASSAQLMMLISSGQVQGSLPTGLDERRQGMLDNLRGASDQDFDDRYLDQQANAHREGLLLFNGYKTAGSDAALKTFATEVAPKLQTHLDMINMLDRNTRADDQAAGAPAGNNMTRR